MVKQQWISRKRPLGFIYVCASTSIKEQVVLASSKNMYCLWIEGGVAIMLFFITLIEYLVVMRDGKSFGVRLT